MKRAAGAALALLVLFGAAARPSADAGGKFQDVTVHPGDTLWSIANRYLKDPKMWSEILRYNKALSSDPTVALPGMTLRVPVGLIKEELRAAILVELVNQVLSRRKESADWKQAAARMQLYRDDGLRTLADSRAKVEFTGGDLLSLEPNSMAILKPLARDKEGADLDLQRGGVVATRAKTITASAKIIPKTGDTRYTADVREDLSTRVEVFTGKADVVGAGSTVEVAAGQRTDVPLDGAPTLPIAIPDMPRLEERMTLGGVLVRKRAGTPHLQRPGSGGTMTLGGGEAAASAGAAPAGPPDDVQLAKDIKSLDIGVPIAGYHVQASDTPDFRRVLFDKNFDADEAIDPSGFRLPQGVYWWRIAVIDLLGTPGKWEKARQYYIGKGGAVEAVQAETSAAAQSAGAAPAGESFQSAFEVVSPPEDGELVRVPRYHLQGHADAGVTVTMNNRPLRLDRNGNFGFEILLKEGINRFRFLATDERGNETETVRRVTYEP